MISALHWFLAIASTAVMLLAGLEASRRALLKRPPGATAARINAVVLLLLGVTAASGLGLFVAGIHPRKELHFVYALLAFAAVPVANALGSRGSPQRHALVCWLVTPAASDIAPHAWRGVF
jgi:hypothetical protein